MASRARFVALYCVYHDDLWLQYSVSSVYDCVDAIVFLVNHKPWFGPESDNSGTLQCISSLPDPEKKITVVRELWADEIAQRNFSLAFAQYSGFDYGFIVDADEIYDPAVLQRMMDFAAERPAVGCWHMMWYTYWKSIRFRIEPPENYQPPVFVRLGAGGFVETRNIAADKHELIPPEVGMCHHMSYARTDELIQRKIHSFSHAQQIGPDWYKNIWLAWDSCPELANIHPTIPSQYARAIPVRPDFLPPILKELASRHPNFPR